MQNYKVKKRPGFTFLLAPPSHRLSWSWVFHKDKIHHNCFDTNTQIGKLTEGKCEIVMRN